MNRLWYELTLRGMRDRRRARKEAERVQQEAARLEREITQYNQDWEAVEPYLRAVMPDLAERLKIEYDPQMSIEELRDRHSRYRDVAPGDVTFQNFTFRPSGEQFSPFLNNSGDPRVGMHFLDNEELYRSPEADSGEFSVSHWQHIEGGHIEDFSVYDIANERAQYREDGNIIGPVKRMKDGSIITADGTRLE
ncbi:MAG: hypothetical protein OXR66_08765 [Candidatus Woesearchaeota archaeon]|nr:hypothetical protein [Candidatus Woesearchaeota archaeon]